MCKKIKATIIFIFLLLSCSVKAGTVFGLGEQEHLYLDKTELVEQQIGLLKKRLDQANHDLIFLQQERKKGFIFLTDDQANRYLLYKTDLNIATTKSNLDSVSIELIDSQQVLVWLEKNIQEIENQLNALRIFDLKHFHDDEVQMQSLRSELQYQQGLYQLEKMRGRYLANLQKTETAVFQLYRERYAELNAFLKSRKMLHIKEHQVKSELEFQQQQNYWLGQLASLYAQIKIQPADSNKEKYLQIERDISYANENINIIYLKNLITRHQDQIRQMWLSISHTNSISLLNSLSDQAQVLSKQIIRAGDLINRRLDIVNKRHTIYSNEGQLYLATSQGQKKGIEQFKYLENIYHELHKEFEHLNLRLVDFRGQLDKLIQHELSARQGLPGFSSDAWLDLGKEALMAPMLSYKLLRGFAGNVIRAMQKMPPLEWLFFIILEATLIVSFSSIKKRITDYLKLLENTVTAKQLLLSLLSRNLMPLFLIGNAALIFYFLNIPEQQSQWLLDLIWAWLLFKTILSMARAGLVETLHDGQGYDVQLYYQIKKVLMVGSVVTFIAIFLHQLPLIYELKDFFDRFFLVLLLWFSVLILRSWRVVPELILQYIDPRRTYLKRLICLLGVFIPGLLFINSLMGVFGFVNLVWMISWYEGIFTAVLICYFLLRGLLSDAMEALSHLLICHVSNGWLWTEAFLKPLHTVLRLGLFFGAWVMLFLFYGWDQQSPVVEQLTKLLFYPLLNVLNTTITPINILAALFAVSLFYWAARWTREFVFRLLLSRTADQGIRNSISILSQYAVVVAGALICLRLLGIDLHNLFLVASGLLIAVGFGLRDLVNNFACGLLLLFERPLRVGDIVSVNNQEGQVLHIGSRAVTIRTWDHMEVIVPNTEFFNKYFVNWTVKDDIVRTVITIKIDRQDNPHDVQKVILNVLHQHKDVLSEPEPEVLMKEMIDTVCEFEVRYFINVKQVISRVNVRSDVLFSLWNAFAESGIKAPHLRHEILMTQPALLPLPS